MSYNTSYEVESFRTVRPVVSQRNLVITRSSTGPSSSSSTTMQRRTYPASPALMQNSEVGALKSNREKEKRAMQDLNERFANYIEKVRFLEAQNRKLADELDKLKDKWGKETTQIKAMYETELSEAKRLLEDAEKEKARLEQRVAALEEQLEELRRKLHDATKAAAEIREKIDQQNQQLSDFEAEINLLRRRVEGLTGDKDKDKRQIAQLQDALNRARIDLDNETLLHIDAENRRQALEDELEFLKNVHDQELKELAALAYRDTTSENREFWKNEMGTALREIQKVYDDKMDKIRDDMDTFYSMKVQEFRTGATRNTMDSAHTKEETVRLRTQLQDLRNKLNDLENKNNMLQRELENLRREKEEREKELLDEKDKLEKDVIKMRAELEAINRELQDLQDTRLSLELEIAAYRKLLEGEENRQGLKGVVDSLFGAINKAATGPDDTVRVRQNITGEVTSKMTNQRTAKGAAAIGDCAPDGSLVIIENTGHKDEDVAGWTVQRLLDNEISATYQLPGQLPILKPGTQIKLYAKGKKPSSANKPEDIETPVNNWGTGGKQINTELVNKSGEVRASLIQKTTLN